jgi:hypothetical protein
MADRDAFGLRTGANSSTAAALAARPNGTTMGEISDTTGDTQYDLFRKLEAAGHLVRREGTGRGMRIFLRHKDEHLNANDPQISDSDLAEDAGVETVDGEVDRWTLSFERDLQRALRGSLEQLEPGLSAVDNGREDGFRDITAKDNAGNIVVIELKATTAGPKAVTQILAYMGELKLTTAPPGLRGILVAPDFNAKALAAASMIPNLILKRYVFHLTFETA